MPDWLILATAALALFSQTAALIVGMNRFKKWLVSAIVEPYVKPIKEGQDKLEIATASNTTMLHEHDRYIYMLLGKNFGSGDPKIDLNGLIEQMEKREAR